jgi:hypothetical protein
MTQEFTVPGKEFWTVTPFRFSIPDGWVARPTVDHLAFMHVDGDDTVNCGIGWRRVSPGVDLRRMVQIDTLALRKQYPDTLVLMSRFGRLGDRVAYFRVSELTHPVHGRYGQVFSAFYGPIHGPDVPLELFELRGWCPAGDDERLREITRIVESFRFVFASVRRPGPDLGSDLAAAGA